MHEELLDKSSLPLSIFSLFPYQTRDSMVAIRHFLSAAFSQLFWLQAKSGKSSAIR
jgi:hypothetical protein